jgi:AcrR family transcriptional regulator
MAKRSTARRKPAARAADPSGRSSARSSGRSGTGDDVIDAALKLAAGQGWRRTSLADIAKEAGLSLAELYGRYRSKRAIGEAFIRYIDRATLDGAEKTAGDDTTSVRDRLFELIMRRLDALGPHKAALAAMLRDLAANPLAAACSAARLCRSMAWIAGVAGVPTAGPLGALRVKALAAVYTYVLRVWLRDDSEDHAKTMAALDKALQRAEMLAQSVPAGLRRASA